MCVPRGSAFACFGAAAAFSSLGVGRGGRGFLLLPRPYLAWSCWCCPCAPLSGRRGRGCWGLTLPRVGADPAAPEAAPGVRSSVGPVFLLECLLSAGMEKPKKEKPVKFVYYIDGHQAGAGGCRAAGDVACAEVFIDELWWRRLSPEEPGPWPS